MSKLILLMEATVRQKKSAKIKILVLRNMLDLLGQKQFKELYVDQICERIKISKVTLFKYFPQKEDILLYYYRVWCLETTIKIAESKKEGLDSVRAIFDRLAQVYQEHPGLWLSLISYLTSLSRPPAPFPMKPIERELLFPDVENAATYEVLSLPQLLEKYLLEAVFLSQIKRSSDTKELSHLFQTTLYGSIITCHLRQIDSLQVLFKRNIDILLGGLNPENV